MVTRRDFIKGGGVAATGVALASTTSSLAPGRAVLASRAQSVPAGGLTVDRFRRGGVGPLYWSTYGYDNETNEFIPEEVFSRNVDWIEQNFLRYGYKMICTDGWVDYTSDIDAHGYITKYNDSWSHGWSWWAENLKRRGMELGVYYNPLWVTRSAVEDSSVTVVGRPDIEVADIVNDGDYLNGDGQLYWVDCTRDGAEEYVKGYVDYFRRLGASLLRIDFLGWFEIGFDQSGVTVGVDHGREAYLNALGWMRDAAGDMILSLVMPNMFDHGAGERLYGDMFRADNDVGYGGWNSLSGGSQVWQPIWSQWNNPFMGFTGWSDITGRGNLVLDGDPLYMSAFSNDDERETAISLFVIAGAAIAIADQYDTVKDTGSFFCNEEVLALHEQGLVGKPIYRNPHEFFYDPRSRDPERWIGQLPDGSWAVALFNRNDGPRTVTKSVDFQSDLGIEGEATVRDLWTHTETTDMTSWAVDLHPHACSFVKVTAGGPVRYLATVGAFQGNAAFGNPLPPAATAGYQGYVGGLEDPGDSVTVAMSVARGGRYRIACLVANATGSRSTLDLVVVDPGSGRRIDSAQVSAPSTRSWSTWQTISAVVELRDGTNLVMLEFGEGCVGTMHVQSLSQPAPVGSLD